MRVPCGGLLAAFFQILFVCLKRVTKKVTPLHILITAWMLGAIFAPFGISGALANFSGEGFSVMITVGGYNMFNVGIELAAGNLAGAGVHLGSFLLAVAGLAITALFTFFIYNWTFGRKPLEQVHAEMALNSLKELGYDASMVKKFDKEELEGYDATKDSGVPAGMCEAVKA